MADSRTCPRLKRVFVLGLVLGLIVSAAGVAVDVISRDDDTSVEATDQHVAVSMGSGFQHMCAVTETGSMKCWGYKWDGGLANGSGGFAQRFPPQVALTPVDSSITAGATQTTGTCALVGTTVQCWAYDGIIEDGTGSLFSDPPWGTSTPRTYGFGAATKVAGRCALLVDGTVQCQGWNHYGQLGNGGLGWAGAGYPTPPPSSATAVTVSGLNSVIDITSQSSFLGGYCALRDDGDGTTSVWCWGLNRDGEIGNGEFGTTSYGAFTDDRYVSTPVQVAGIDDAIAVRDSCAIREGGEVTCWGRNWNGRFDPTQPGDSLNVQLFGPAEVPSFAGAVDVVVSSQKACAAFADGTVRCQGVGALGDGTQDFASQRSILVPGLGDEPDTEVVDLGRVGFGGICARTRSGKIACWGTSASYLGIGSSSNNQVLTPTYVIGFGGELPVDDLTVSLAIEPGEVELDFDDGGDVVPETVIATVTVTNESEFDVDNVSLDGTLATTLESGEVKAITQVGPPTPAPDGVTGKVELGTIDAGTTSTVTYEFEVSGAGVFGVEALVLWADPQTSATERGFAEATVDVQVDSALEVEINGQLTNSPNIIAVVADIGNDGGSPISNIDWGEGLVREVVGDGDPPLALASGPIPGLPTSLAPGGTMTVRWTFFVENAGAEEFTLAGTGESALGGVSARDQLTATITDRQIEAIDHQRQALQGLEGMLRNGASTLLDYWEESIAAARAASNQADEFYERNYDAYRRLGFGDTTARFLANGDVQREWVSRYFQGYVESADQRIDQLGAEGGEAIYRNGSKLWSFMTDPEVRADVANRVVDWGTREAGYLADGLADPNRPGVLETTRTTWDGIWTEVDESIEFAADGQVEIWRLLASEFAADPFAFAEKMGRRHGDQGATVAWYTAAGVVEEVVTGGAGPVLRAGRGLEGGIDAMRTTAKVDNGVDATDAALDAFTDSQRRFAEAERRSQRIHQTPYGQRISPEALERYGGFNAADADAVMAIVDDVRRDFDGLEIEIAFRTAEPLSVGIDGIGKRAFTKEKAVGAMDLLLGAPPSAAGKVTVFEPRPLPESTIRAIEADNPGFRARYNDRLATQQDNWQKWNNGEGKLYELVQASRANPDGINILDGVPGQNTFGVKYLEQLDDPQFLAANPQITDEVIQQLRNDPNVTFAKLDVDRAGDGFTFSDHTRTVGPGGEVTLTKKPIISDYDGQAVVVANGGRWPDGVRGQVETLVKQRLDQIGRHGRHGWSGTANDLPSDLFHLPVEYAMSTAHPSVARDMAEDFAARFGELAQQFRVKAQRIEAGLDALSPVDRRAAEAQISRLRSTADKYSGYNVDEILRKWPPTEKTIVFSKGGISVGSNGGTS